MWKMGENHGTRPYAVLHCRCIALSLVGLTVKSHYMVKKQAVTAQLDIENHIALHHA